MPDVPTPTDPTEPASVTFGGSRVLRIARDHVDLVYSTARRLVGDSHLADDVTQAAFVMLVRKIDTIDPRTMAGWLVNVTRLAAREALRSHRRRRGHEAIAAQLRSAATEPAEDATAADLRTLLDSGLSQLAPADRTAVVLRFLEGKSFAEVADSMGATEEGARKRVSRAVEKLRTFFLRNGVQTTVGGLAIALAAEQAAVAPAGLLPVVISTKPAADAPAALARGVLTMMKWTRIKIGIAVAAVLAVTSAVGYGIDAMNSPPQTRPAAVAQTQSATPAVAGDLTRLKQQRVDALARAQALATQLYERGLGDFAAVRQCERELLEAKLSLADTPAARGGILQETLKVTKDQEALTNSRFKAGLVSDLDVAESTADRLKVEIMIAEESGR